MTEEQLLEKLGKNFEVECKGAEIYHPAKLHEFSMYLGGKWYKLTAKPGSYDDKDPIGVLDVTVLSKHVLADILDIQDLRTSKRIDFVGGIRGLEELKRRVDNGEMKVAFALYPVSMQQLLILQIREILCRLKRHGSNRNCAQDLLFTRLTNGKAALSGFFYLR